MTPLITPNWLRRLLCLAPLPEAGEGPAALRASPSKPNEAHTLRQALYPLTLLFTVCYMILEIREFWLPLHPRPVNFPPELYEGLLGIFAGDQELRRWSGRPDRYVLASEFVIYAWWILYLVMAMAINFNPGLNFGMPKDLRGICMAVMGIFLGVGVSKYFQKRRGDRPAAQGAGYAPWTGGEENGLPPDRQQEDQVLAYVREKGRITSHECAELLGMSYRHARRTLSGMAQAGVLELDGDKNSPDAGYHLPSLQKT